MVDKKKILCTGSGGFIFSNFVRYALKNNSNYSIASIDRCDDKNILNTIYSNKGHEFYIGDISNSHFVNVIFEIEKPDYVIHGAAKSFVDDSISGAGEFVNSNVLGTQVIIDACLKYNVKKMVYISTDEVYGQLKSEDEASWSESCDINPRNPYSATKASGELLVKAAGETHGLNYNITRSCNNYGPRQPRRNLIPVIISNIIEKKEVPIFGSGMQVRDWIHVQDNCQAILDVLEKGEDRNIYNISAKQEFTNVEVFQEVCNVLGGGYDLLKHVKDRPGHDFRYSINNDKIKDLGWAPTFKFKEGINHTVNWYKNNLWFVKK
jgi:dTDP-glucose 4,6-dehydratase